MTRLVALTTLFALFLVSCSTRNLSPKTANQQSFAKNRTSTAWWAQLNDSSLNHDIEVAYTNNPSLQAVALRIQQADAAVAQARSLALPSLNLGFGYQEGRKREIDFGPYDLAPWQSSAGLSWEIDITGKLKAARDAAIEQKNASDWDYQAARLLLASRIASVRMNLYRFNTELENLKEALLSNRQTLSLLAEKSRAGLISDSVIDQQTAEEERLIRTQLDLKRLRDLTIVQLRTLRGGSNPDGINQHKFPQPRTLKSYPVNQLLASHPEILAAESRVRSAFQIERSSRLNLLPSFQVNLLASGGQKSLADQFRIWTMQIGPSLDIPIYDPARVAVLKANQAKTKIAAANYRDTIFKILAEIDTARINFNSRSAQLATAERETLALARNRENSHEQFDAGLISQIEYLETERQWLAAKRSQAAHQQEMNTAQINLIKATGGARI